MTMLDCRLCVYLTNCVGCNRLPVAKVFVWKACAKNVVFLVLFPFRFHVTRIRTEPSHIVAARDNWSGEPRNENATS